MTDSPRIVRHRVEFSTSAKLLLGGVIVAVMFHAVMSLVSPVGTHAQSLPRSVTMTCRWQQPPPAQGMVPFESLCTGTFF